MRLNRKHIGIPNKQSSVSLCHIFLFVMTMTVLLVFLFVVVSVAKNNVTKAGENSEATPIANEIAGLHTLNNVWDWGTPNKTVDSILTNVEEKYKDFCKDILDVKTHVVRKQIWSQAYQEWFLYHNYFRVSFCCCHHCASENNVQSKYLPY
ncbi:hypothetical protein RFI_02333 [Reticulomyxa filosa]|uniref:Uncharacterized protein n=1 Tax=Reticulomyxa filosa TaxID=46433 RepID=X6P9A2_RETFI|nr:hypothetical protein RFI_02333 [Reticulomyxa filosa]|eukprot:ETO34756.1 hypothetical protein RFI_02333 [Reticulomyxa filosa]